MIEPTTETIDGEPYRYYPLGDHIVRALGVCGARPTFKYTRIEIAGALDRVAAGETIDEIVSGYRGQVSPGRAHRGYSAGDPPFHRLASRSRDRFVIVLDEQLMGRGIASDIARWYAGSVRVYYRSAAGYSHQGRGHPGFAPRAALCHLRHHQRPRFLAENPGRQAVLYRLRGSPRSTGWRDSRHLRSLFRRPGFDTKAERLGKVVRVSSQTSSYYSLEQRTVEPL